MKQYKCNSTKIFLDNIFDSEIKEYLLSQNGIENVKIINKEFISEIDITNNKELTPIMILKYIELYQNEQIPMMIGFNKSVNFTIKEMKYIVDDICCEYCYKGLVTELFKNEKIKSVASNFDYHKPAFNIEFLIEYNENYDEQYLIKYINDKLKN